jgi:hypothetical protein
MTDPLADLQMSHDVVDAQLAEDVSAPAVEADISTARHGNAERLDALAVGHGPSLEIAERDAERRLRQREIDCRDARAAMRGMRREVA